MLHQLNGVFWYSLKFYFKSELISLMVQAGLFWFFCNVKNCIIVILQGCLNSPRLIKESQSEQHI